MFLDTGFSSANPHLVTSDASRVTTPVEDIETFDPSPVSESGRLYSSPERQ